MGRLFWKIFLAIFLAQVATVAVVETLFWLHHPGRGVATEPPPGPPPGGWQPPPREPGPPPPREPPAGRLLLTILPLAIGLAVSLAFAALLARYLSKPILGLRAAFDEVGRGNFGTRVAASMGSRRDELADLGRDFDRTARQLKGLIDSQRRLLHDVSHELRSPLARIQLAIDLIRQQPEHGVSFLERIERESGRIDQLVEELLTLARLEARTYGELKDEVEVAELVAEIVDDARFEAEAKGGRVEFAAAAPALVRGRAELLQRAIENVVRNAVKHTFPGTAVAVSVVLDGRQVGIQVADDGPGVPESALEAMFEPFVRYGEERGGYGLGLAIARQVVEAHGGSIRAENGEAGGLRVGITLPAA